MARAKLTEQIVRQIRAEYQRGRVTYEQLAERHGVTRNTIRLVVERLSWQRVR